MISSAIANKLTQRRWIYAGLLTTVALLLMSILFGSLQSAPPRMAEVGAPSHVPTAVLAPDSEKRDQPANPPTQLVQAQDRAVPASEQQVVMRINDAAVYVDELVTIRQLNNLLNSFVSHSTETTPQAELEQLLNTRLVEDAARAVSFQLDKGLYEQSLAQWLAANQKTEVDLQATLHENGVTMDAFAAYFRQLLLVDTFLGQQTIAKNQSRETLLRQLQEQARISFGSAANEYLRAQQQSNLAAVAVTDDSAESGSLPATGAAEQPAMRFEQFPGLITPELSQSSIATATTAGTGPSETNGVAHAEPTPTPTPAPIGLAPGNRAPTFALAALDAEQPTHNLANWHGTPIVLSFWTTWCPYCRKQTPVLVAADQLTTTEHVQFVGINVNERPETVRSYVETHQISYPTLLDLDGTVASSYGVRGYPTTYFIGANGHIVTKHVGVLSEAQLSQYIAQLAP